MRLWPAWGSARKVGQTLLALPGRPVSPTAVNRIARILDAAVQAFHRRPLANDCKALMLDGVVLGFKTGTGAWDQASEAGGSANGAHRLGVADEKGVLPGVGGRLKGFPGRLRWMPGART